MKKVILILGAPGSGKTTTIQKIKTIEFSHFSIGATYRQLANENSDIGKEVIRYINNGQIVPIHIAQKVIGKYILDGKDLILIDDYPRDLEQALMLETIISQKAEILGVIEFLVDKEIALSRILKRSRGVDDTPDKFEERMQVYNENIEAIRSYYKVRNNYSPVNSNDDMDNVEIIINNLLSSFNNGKAQ